MNEILDRQAPGAMHSAWSDDGAVVLLFYSPDKEPILVSLI